MESSYLTVKSLFLHLRLDGSNDLWVTMTGVVDTEASQTVNVFFTSYAHEDAAARRTVSPFYSSEVFSNTLAVFQKA